MLMIDSNGLKKDQTLLTTIYLQKWKPNSNGSRQYQQIRPRWKLIVWIEIFLSICEPENNFIMYIILQSRLWCLKTKFVIILCLKSIL